MNSKMTRIRTVLRYLTLGPMIAFGLLSIIATGGGGGGGSAPPGGGGGGGNPFGLLATDDSFPSLFYQIDAASGASTRLSGFGLGGFRGAAGLAFDPNSNTLYGADTNTDQLITIDPVSGAGTAVGLSGLFSVGGLAFDPNTNTLYGTTIGLTPQLITIDPVTGAGTAVGPLGRDFAGLAFDPITNTLYPTDPFSMLFTIDPATGAATAVGSTGAAMVGLAFR